MYSIQGSSSFFRTTFIPGYLFVYLDRMSLGGRKKIDFLEDISPIRGPTKKIDLFQTKCKKKISMPCESFFKTIFLYCHTCLSTGSKEIQKKGGGVGQSSRP